MQARALWFIVGSLSLSLGCAGAPKLDFSDQSIPTTEDWGTAEPEAADLERYTAARDYAEDQQAVAMLVIEGTDIVFEWARDDYDPTTPRHLFSGTKSFSCAVAELLVEDEVLDLDAPVSEAIPELAAGDDVTARHLLQFTSGIKQSWFALSSDGMKVEQRIEDKYAHAVALESQWDAGSKFEYGSSHQMVFGEQVDRLAGRSALDILDERVFAPIGFRYGGWHHDPSGNPMLPYGAWTTAHEWARYGVLIRDDGLWEGERVLPEGVRERCTTGSEANPAYGLTWWLNQPIGEDADLSGVQLDRDGDGVLHPGGYEDAFVAAGHNDQRLYVFPSEDLVVVMLSDGSRQFRDREFATRLLP
ncbi:MAG: serine hydrolase [Proteobacteria bacterium]|nr:serine hydrolase [Pseudomonadota bacterium]